MKGLNTLLTQKASETVETILNFIIWHPIFVVAKMNTYTCLFRFEA